MLSCTAMALIEEAITTTMTNLAPAFGSTPEEAHITASTNYFHVVLCHSVVLFFFMFVVWAWMLSRWDFSPLAVLLLFGITGPLAEATINPTSVVPPRRDVASERTQWNLMPELDRANLCCQQKERE